MLRRAILALLLAVAFLGLDVANLAPDAQAQSPAGPLVNPSFETGDLTGWTVWGDASACAASVSPLWAAAGVFSARLQDLSPAASCGFYQQLPVTPGDGYRIRAKARVIDGAAQLYLRWVDAAGRDVSSSFPVATTTTTGVNDLVAVGIAPPTATDVRVWYYTTTAGTGNSLVDDLLLTIIPAKEDGHPDPGGFGTTPAAPADPACVTSANAYAIQMVYVTAENAPENPDADAILRGTVRQLAGLVEQEAGWVAKLRFVCSGGQVDVAHVQVPWLPTAKTSRQAFDEITQALDLQGYDSAQRKYLVSVDIDFVPTDGFVGWARWSAEPGGVDTNSANAGPNYGLQFRNAQVAWRTQLHELTHILGAVLESAPESSLRGHCNDENDIMCYNDDGPHTPFIACSGYDRWDCNHDTYFDPYPRVGSHLSTGWNIGGRYNRFLDFACPSFSDTSGFDGLWFARNTLSTGAADICVRYVGGGGQPLVGNWDERGDGLGTVSGNSWTLNHDLDGGTDYSFSYGLSGDQKVVGDWNGDGIETVGVYRPGFPGTWHLADALDGVTDHTVSWGSANDFAVTGDWDRDGFTDLGIVRVVNGGLQWHLNINLDGNFDSTTEASVTFGSSGDKWVVGDWDGDGRDTAGYVRNGNEWHVKRDWETTLEDTFTYGSWTDTRFAAADFDGDGRDGPVVIR